MARPNKIGLDYFPFDIDFFEDEKIEAIFVEFGIKGEITVVKLLCAIYRNGYFILWNDRLKIKLLKNLPGISSELLEQIINRLVKWDFFNESLFNSASILTSLGIQKRYFSVIKRRKQNEDYPYLLINEYNKPINVVNNEINVDNNATKKRKGKEKKEILSNESIKKKAASAATLKRKESFYHSLIPYADKYGKEMLRAFFDYWSEMNASQTKMRFEKQPTWELSKRLATWANNEKKYEKNRRAATGKTKQERYAEFAKAITAKLAAGDTGSLQDGGESALPF